MSKINIPSTTDLKNIGLLVAGIIVLIIILPLIKAGASVTKAIQKIISIPGDVMQAIEKDSVAHHAMYDFFNKLSAETVYNPKNPEHVKLMEKLKQIPFGEEKINAIIRRWKQKKLGAIGGKIVRASDGLGSASKNVLSSLGNL